MTITVQNNSGTISGANAYIDSDYADAYFTDRGKDDSEWADFDDEVKESAIIQATQYIDHSNIGKWKGRKLTAAQMTAFPRSGVYDLDGYEVVGVPELLKMATAEYAIRAATADLAPDVVYDDSNIPLKSKREKIGPLEETVVYQDDATFSALRAYPYADMLLKQFVINANFIMRG